MIEQLPLSFLGELLDFAQAKERNREKSECEKALFPLWLANYALSELRGEKTADFESFISQIMTYPDLSAADKKQSKTAEEITAELMPLVLADRNKSKGG